MNKILEYCGIWKPSSKGWISFNGKCCTHNGDLRNDTKSRAGIRNSDDDGFVYHCFNCGFKTGWKPGSNIGTKVSNLLDWYNVPDDEIKQIKFKAYQYKLQKQENLPKQITVDDENKHVYFNFPEENLPKDFYTLDYCMNNYYNNQYFLKAIDYLLERGNYIAEYGEFFWSPKKQNSIILPCKWNNKYVGWIERSLSKKAKLRYINNFPKDFLFNTDEALKGDVIFVCEGPFDAISIGGIATNGDKISDKQIQWLKQQNKEIVIIPDRENNGGHLVDIAINNKWNASIPEWDDDVKDCNDALKKYGPLFVSYSLMNSICDYNKLRTKKFKLKRRKEW